MTKVNPEHYHIDLNYYATSDTYNVKPEEGEAKSLYWFTKEDLNEIDNAPHNVIMMAKESLNLLNQK